MQHGTCPHGARATSRLCLAQSVHSYCWPSLDCAAQVSEPAHVLGGDGGGRCVLVLAVADDETPADCDKISAGARLTAAARTARANSAIDTSVSGWPLLPVIGAGRRLAGVAPVDVLADESGKVRFLDD